jgi:DNA polymerase III psi subunit
MATPPIQAIHMINSRQQAYLDAMDIGVWCLRDAVNTPGPSKYVPAALKLGPGRGGVLLICAADSDSASRISSDISRCLSNVPVWAWPDTNPAATILADAVEENLFTTVAIFGRDLSAKLFDLDMPSHLNSAKLIQLPSMEDIQNRAEARQTLWDILCRSGMVAAHTDR